jgi:hypothetical protein
VPTRREPHTQPFGFGRANRLKPFNLILASISHYLKDPHSKLSDPTASPRLAIATKSPGREKTRKGYFSFRKWEIGGNFANQRRYYSDADDKWVTPLPARERKSR